MGKPSKETQEIMDRIAAEQVNDVRRSNAFKERMLFEESSDYIFLDQIFRNREDVVRHCIKVIEAAPIEAACLLARKEQLGSNFKPMLELAAKRGREALDTIEAALHHELCITREKGEGER